MEARSLGPDSSGTLLLAEGDRVSYYGPPIPGAPGGASDPEAFVIRPGRVNAHTHIYSGLAPLGMPPPEPPPTNFLEILERVWWRLDRALDAESLRASARLYVAEALLAGTTTLIDHHESPNFIEGSLDILADACEELGVRAILGFGATERNGGLEEARRGLAECRRFIRENDRPRVRGIVALHASFTVSDETLEEASDLCRELGTVMHVHVAEDEADMEDARSRGYVGPLQRLLAFEVLPEGSILAHGVHCTPDEVHLASARGLWFVQNPRSNRGNGVGYARHLGASGRVALGTDGYPARMDEEVLALFEEARANGDDRTAVEPRVEGAYELVAELFGVAFEPLAPGSMADVAAVHGATVEEVWVGGEAVVRAGVLVHGDIDEIRAEAATQAERLWERMRTLT